MSYYIATVHLVLDDEDQYEPEDIVSESLRDIPGIIDWGYVKDENTRYQEFVPETPYWEGDFYGYLDKKGDKT